MLCYEDGTWGLTTFGVAKVEPPHDFAGMCALADEVVPPHIAAAIRQGEPIGEVAFHKYPTSRWRRYHKLDRFPAGILPFGDAVASFNPTFGQGMTMTSLQAGHLRRALESPGADLAREFNAATAKSTFPVWTMNAIGDLVCTGPRGRCRGGTARWVGCSTSSSARPRRILFSPNGFCAGSACWTASTWCRRCGWSAGPSGHNMRLWLAEKRAHASRRARSRSGSK